jgi:hypothetical protein
VGGGGGDLKVWPRGAVGVGSCGGTMCPNSCRPSSSPMKTNVVFVSPHLANRSYIIFRRLALADGNYISFVSFFFKPTKATLVDEIF